MNRIISLMLSILIIHSFSSFTVAGDRATLKFNAPENPDYKVATSGFFSTSGKVSPNGTLVIIF
jgi:hypothetical protein